MTDPQTAAMLEARRREEVLRYAQEQGAAAPEAAADHAQVDWTNADSVLNHLKDPQLMAAVKAVQGKVDSGTWQPTGETQNAKGRIAGAELLKLTQYQQRLLRELARTEKRMDAIETAAGDEAPKIADFWNNELDLTGGILEIRDKSGKVIATLDITGNNLERWLIDADVKKHDEVVK
jgi:hypothetical protein